MLSIKIKHIGPLLLFVLIFFILIYFFLYLNSALFPDISDKTALSIIQSKINVEIPLDSANIVYKQYSTNIREEEFLIVCDTSNLDINRTIHELGLTPVNVAVIEETDIPQALQSILDEFYEDDPSIHCRYAINHDLNGNERPGSDYLIALSFTGRLLVYFSP